MASQSRWGALAFLLLGAASGFILPGIAPHDYSAGERVWLKVNSLTSPQTQVPYETYRFDFCKPKKIIDSKENFGEFLSGDRIQNSPYEIFTIEDTFCNLLCAVKGRPHKVKQMQRLVAKGYHHNYLLDSFPAASVSDDEAGGETSYARGIPIGYVGPTGKYYINNHAQFIVKYHSTPEGKARVVGLYAEPYSVRHKFAAGVDYDFRNTRAARKANAKLGASAVKTCSGYPMTVTDATFAGPQELKEGAEVIYTYDVVWEPSEVAWASRWDIYLATSDTATNVHWFSIMNALVVVIALGGLLAVVLARSLRADLARYNADRAPLVGGEDDAEEIDEYGWKTVHADVFRPPPASGALCALVATGCQLGAAGFVVLGFAYVGFVSPANRGSLALAMLASFAMLGSVAGYVAARLYKALGGQQWMATTALTAALFPVPCGVVFASLDAALVAAGSSGAAPLPVVVQLVALALFVAVPLVYLGAAYAFAQPALEFPAKPARVAKEVPKQPAALAFPVAAAVCGCLPFGACFVELYFVLDSLWMESYYYLFGFAAAGFCLLLLSAAETTALITYYTLCAENYNWWWRAFLAPATTGLYVFVYAAYYYSSHLEGGSNLSFCLYFGYMGLISLAVALVAGAAGWMASFRLVTYIFAQIKFD